MGLFSAKTETAKTPNSTQTVNGVVVPYYKEPTKKKFDITKTLTVIGAGIAAFLAIKSGTVDQKTGEYTPATEPEKQIQDTNRGKNALTFVGIGLIVIVGGFFGIKYLGKKK